MAKTVADRDRDIKAPNAVKWADEKDGKRSARLAHENLKLDEDEVPLASLQEIRKSRIYVSEKPIAYGYGIKKKRGTRVFHVVAERHSYPHLGKEGDDILVYTADYDAKGNLIASSVKTPPILQLDHAIERLFERRRTNSWLDVRAAIAELVKLPPPDGVEGVEPGHIAVEMKVHIHGLGGFPLEVKLFTSTFGLTGWGWRVKTFKSEKK